MDKQIVIQHGEFATIWQCTCILTYEIKIMTQKEGRREGGREGRREGGKEGGKRMSC